MRAFIAIPLLGVFCWSCAAPIDPVEEEVRSWIEVGSMHGTVGDVSVEGRAVLTMAERDVGFREASIGVNGYGERGYVNACVTFPRGIESLPLQGRARVVGVDLWACAVDELEDSRYDVNAQSVEVLVEPTEMGSNVTVFAELPNGDELEFSFHAWFHQRESSMGWAEPMLELADEPY